MQEYVGELKELGDGVNTIIKKSSYTKHSYIEIGDTILRKKNVISGLASKLQAALKQDGPVTLYVSGDFVIGVRLPDGKAYRSIMPNKLLAMLTFAVFLVLGLLLTPVLIGIPLLWWAFKSFQYVRACADSLRIPNAIAL